MIKINEIDELNRFYSEYNKIISFEPRPQSDMSISFYNEIKKGLLDNLNFLKWQKYYDIKNVTNSFINFQINNINIKLTLISVKNDNISNKIIKNSNIGSKALSDTEIRLVLCFKNKNMFNQKTESVIKNTINNFFNPIKMDYKKTINNFENLIYKELRDEYFFELKNIEKSFYKTDLFMHFKENKIPITNEIKNKIKEISLKVYELKNPTIIKDPLSIPFNHNGFYFTYPTNTSIF
jgi:uncharacterized protein YlaI